MGSENRALVVAVVPLFSCRGSKHTVSTFVHDTIFVKNAEEKAMLCCNVKALKEIFYIIVVVAGGEIRRLTDGVTFVPGLSHGKYPGLL